MIRLLADDAKVIAHLRDPGAHLGMFGSIPATGKKIDEVPMTVVRMANGKCAGRWDLVDQHGA